MAPSVGGAIVGHGRVPRVRGQAWRLGAMGFHLAAQPSGRQGAVAKDALDTPKREGREQLRHGAEVVPLTSERRRRRDEAAGRLHRRHGRGREAATRAPESFGPAPSALGFPVGADRGAVHDDLGQVGVAQGARLGERRIPDAEPRPAPVQGPGALPRAEASRQAAPWDAGARAEDDAGEGAPEVDELAAPARPHPLQ